VLPLLTELAPDAARRTYSELADCLHTLLTPPAARAPPAASASGGSAFHAGRPTTREAPEAASLSPPVARPVASRHWAEGDGIEALRATLDGLWAAAPPSAVSTGAAAAEGSKGGEGAVLPSLELEALSLIRRVLAAAPMGVGMRAPQRRQLLQMLGAAAVLRPREATVRLEIALYIVSRRLLLRTAGTFHRCATPAGAPRPRPSSR